MQSAPARPRDGPRSGHPVLRRAIGGLDPVSSKLLDDLILECVTARATVVVVSHELASIFAIGDNSVFLDADTKSMIAQGNPKTLLAESTNPKVCAFLTRDATLPAAAR